MTFYLMVGIPGSGKSTYAKTIPNAVIHSSDAIRDELGGGEYTKSKNSGVFDILHQRVKNDLMAGKDVVYDATSITRERRMDILRMVWAVPGVKTVCLFLNTPLSTALARNNNRERKVPVPAIMKMNRELEPPTKDEGWDEVRYIKS